jgi:hypothetical protein
VEQPRLEQNGHSPATLAGCQPHCAPIAAPTMTSPASFEGCRRRIGWPGSSWAMLRRTPDDHATIDAGLRGHWKNLLRELEAMGRSPSISERCCLPTATSTMSDSRRGSLRSRGCRSSSGRPMPRRHAAKYPRPPPPGSDAPRANGQVPGLWTQPQGPAERADQRSHPCSPDWASG